MSEQTSPSSDRRYGIARACRVWDAAKATSDRQHPQGAAGEPGPIRRRVGVETSLAPGGPAPPAASAARATRCRHAPHQGAARPVTPRAVEHAAVADL